MKNQRLVDYPPRVSATELRNEVMSFMASLLFLSQKEISSRLKAIKELPLEALMELRKILHDAARKQHHYFEVLEGRDPLFPSKIKMVLYKAELAKIAGNK